MRTHPIRRKNQSHGFTLVELVVVIGIFSVVTTIGVTVFGSLTSAWNETKMLTELDFAASEIFESIHQDLADVMSSELAGSAIRGKHKTFRDEIKFRDRLLGDDDIAFPIQTSGRANRSLSGGTVRYHVSRQDGGHVLVRNLGGLGEQMPVGGLVPIADRVDTIRFRCEYSSPDTGEWRDEWTEVGHPSAVRVSVTLQHKTREWLQVSRKAVFQINVN